MKTLSRFVAKFTSLIVAVLSCFDRVIFKGHLPISNGPALEGFVDHVLKIRRCDFMAFAEQQSEALVDHAKRLAEEDEHTRTRLVAVDTPWDIPQRSPSRPEFVQDNPLHPSRSVARPRCWSPCRRYFFNVHRRCPKIIMCALVRRHEWH